jgi:hypothetical protein
MHAGGGEPKTALFERVSTCLTPAERARFAFTL